LNKEQLLEILKKVKDPELPLSIMDPQLNVLTPDLVEVNEKEKKVEIQFRPTIPTCPMGGMIGIVIRKVALEAFPKDWNVNVTLVPGTHVQESMINQLINDEERYAATLKNMEDRGMLPYFQMPE
jgi:metal-sulfur cluster biosynthetic enzyme